MAYRILCLDGGGMRGYLTALLLRRLMAAAPGLVERADLIAGTSSGGLIALGLARGLDPAALVELFETRAAEIFADSVWDDVADIGRLVGAEYSSRGRERVLRETFGDLRLADLDKRVLIPTFDLDCGKAGGNDPSKPRRWKAKILHNFPGSDSDGEVLAWKAAMWTSAAPIYFPSSDGYVDGGVIAANPAMCALAQTQDERALSDPPRLTDIRLLSLGTGNLRQYVAGERHDWGALQWGRPLVDIVMSGSVDVVSFQCRKMLGERFERISPELDPAFPLPLDCATPAAVLHMRGLATKLELRATSGWLERFW